MNTGYIYKLSAPNCSSVYIGSTKNIKKRFSQHKCSPTKSSKIIMGYPGVNIEILESLEYDDKQELLKRERHHITTNNSINIQVPTRTNIEYYQDKNIQIKEHQNTVIECIECGKSYTRRNSARHFKKYCNKILINNIDV
jgi:predicted GIY-YIG superfamily endonuclease